MTGTRYGAGFTFNGKHSDLFGIRVKSANRAAKPEKRVYRTVIGGRDGTYDFTDNTFSNIIITLECDYTGPDSSGAARELALWLSGPGELVIDGDSGKIYNACLYSEIPLTQTFYTSRFTLAFECFPFAMSLPKQVSAVVTAQGQDVCVGVGGTARTPCVISIKNNGNSQISNLRLTHRKEV